MKFFFLFLFSFFFFLFPSVFFFSFHFFPYFYLFLTLGWKCGVIHIYHGLLPLRSPYRSLAQEVAPIYRNSSTIRWKEEEGGKKPIVIVALFSGGALPHVGEKPTLLTTMND